VRPPRQGMPAVTLWQPWASWIARGLKTIETRGHNRFRALVGRRIAIHAGRTFDDEAARLAAPWLGAEQRERAAEGPFPLGCIVATAEIAQHRPLTRADSAAALCPCGVGLFGLVLTDVLAVDPPVYCRGGRGVWYLSAQMAELVSASERSFA